MPTGYTASIEDGSITNGKEFLMLCARAFGACIEMRDEPLSVPIPFKFSLSPHYQAQVEESEKNLKKLLSFTIADAQDEIDKEYQSNQKQCADVIKRKEEINLKYKAVYDDVKRWNPPTPEHESLKRFALEQIGVSCDSDNDYWEKELKKPKASPEEWLMVRIESERDSLEMSRELWREEVKRVKSKNKWLALLRESLG